MLGFIVGTVCLVAFIKVARGFGGSCTSRDRHRWLLRRLFRRLDTTPGQEKAMESALGDAEAAASKLKDDLRAVRSEVAKAMAAEVFDTAAVREAFAKARANGDELEKAVIAGLQSTHEALGPEQRRALSELIAFGPRHGCGGFGHRRGGGHCGRGQVAI